tara:strand:+ start:248 stop:1102 length:855 start_codon:yes stop_codon:yes gene_type:complete
MGYGDDLLITNFASKIKNKYPDRQIIIGNLSKKEAYHSIIYDNNPNISDCRNLEKHRPIHIINYHSGNRPYIDYEKSTKDNYVWNKKFTPEPGQIYFSEKELNEAKTILDEGKSFWKNLNVKKYKKIIFLETSSTKINDEQFSVKHINKDWGYDNWKRLVTELKNDYLIIHSVHNKTKKIDGIFEPNNINFRLACSIMNYCDIYIGPEGGFGHVAGALNKKAVIYFGGWITPEVIGYNFHESVYYENINSPCGQYKRICNHCSEAREKLTVSLFKEKIIKTIDN